MSKNGTGWILCAVLSSLLCSCSSYAEDIQISMHELDPLIVFDSDRPNTGCIVEIYQKLAKIVGHQGKVRTIPFSRALIELRYLEEADKEDIQRAHLIAVRSVERESHYKWVGPLLFDGVIFYQRANDSRIFNALEDLKEVHGVMQRGIAETEWLKAHGVKVIEVNTQSQALKMLIHYRGDFTPIAILNTEEILEATGISMHQLKRTEIPIRGYPIYMIFSKNTPDTVVEKWQKALEQLNENGQRLDIIQKYIPIYTDELEAYLINKSH